MTCLVMASQNYAKVCIFIELPNTIFHNNNIAHVAGFWSFLCPYIFSLQSENPKGTVLINVGRSNAIEESELLEALAKNWLGEAKIGVFDPQPLPASHPFQNHPNIALHCIAAVSHPSDVADCFKMNYDRFVAQQSLLYTINYVSPFKPM